MPICSPTNKPATHSGVYDPITASVPGLTQGKRYDLIHDNASYTCILINDHGSYFVCDAQDFSKIVNLSTLDDRPAPDDLTWEEDDDYTPPDPADYLAPGIQVIARDVEPVPDGPKSTDELRKYRFKPDLF